MLFILLLNEVILRTILSNITIKYSSRQIKAALFSHPFPFHKRYWQSFDRTITLAPYEKLPRTLPSYSPYEKDFCKMYPKWLHLELCFSDYVWKVFEQSVAIMAVLKEFAYIRILQIWLYQIKNEYIEIVLLELNYFTPVRALT